MKLRIGHKTALAANSLQSPGTFGHNFGISSGQPACRRDLLLILPEQADSVRSAGVPLMPAFSAAVPVATPQAGFKTLLPYST